MTAIRTCLIVPVNVLSPLRVVGGHRRVEVHAHVGGLDSVDERNGALDPAGGDLLSVDRERPCAACAQLAAVIGKIVGRG